MAIDFSPLTGPVAPNGVTRGLGAVSDALEAVLQRRAALQRQQQEIDAQKAAAALVDKRTREINAAQVAQEQEQQKRIAAHERVTEDLAKQQAAETRRQHQAEIMTKVPDLIGKGQGGAVPGLLEASGIGVSQAPLPQNLAQPIEAPQAAVSGLPFAGLMDVTSPAAAIMERKRQQEAQKFQGNNAVLQFEGGRTQNFDMGGMTPEARAEMMKTALDRLPSTDPFVAQAKSAIPVMTAGGMVKPGDENNLYRDATRESAALERAKIAADGQRQGRDPRLKQSVVTGFEGALGNWERAANVDKLTDTKTVVDRAKGLIDQYHKSGATISQRAALYQTARDITGPGVLTAQEFRNTVTGTTGFFGYLKSQAARFEKGDISDQEMKALEDYIRDSEAIVRQKGAASVHNFDKRFSPATQYGANVPEDVAAARGALLDRFGLQPSDLEGHKKGTSGASHLVDEILKGAK